MSGESREAADQSGPGDLNTGSRRHWISILVGLISTLGLIYLWDTGIPFSAVALVGLCLSFLFTYQLMKERDQLTSKQAVVITGCDSGLGYSLALFIKSLGGTVIASVLQHDGPGAEELRKKDIHVLPLDITNKESVQRFGVQVRALIEQNDLSLRALVNNAGIMVFGEFEWLTEEQIRHQVEVNCLGTMRITKELIPLIRAHSGRLIIMGSHCSSQPLPGVSIYGATKSAIASWLISLRVELKKYGVDTVNFVPGSFIQESNIMAQQPKHFDTMKAAMTKEAWSFYGNYFERYSRYLMSLSREVGPRKLEDAHFYKVFQAALLDRYPSATYVCEPWTYTIYYTLFKITPTRIRDLLVERFVQLPSWSEKK
ncbi:estradiol 17-beta-dehydrogenase 2 [Orussus abietinus]|uniref:estradiol 17-beta-dehydrogenase 2 n=1 Tax=Orussus abietinus TaxID=222816 RepID=UPI000625198D|nr:estradiol 17-beta-dehydrogenase 2 [Orussus abietinus]